MRSFSGGGWGWQLVLGVILFAIGASSIAVPALGDLLWPLVLVILGVAVLVRAIGTPALTA